jgi:hypothetical protein
MFGLSEKTEGKLMEEMQNTNSLVDAITLIFHPFHNEIMVIYTKKDAPLTNGKQMVFSDLEMALTFIRGINTQSMTSTVQKTSTTEEKPTIGFMSGLAKAA